MTFELGLVVKDKPYHDTSNLVDVTLTKNRKECSNPLADQNLSDIKTGFTWTLNATGKPAIFCLDDINYQ